MLTREIEMVETLVGEVEMEETITGEVEMEEKLVSAMLPSEGRLVARRGR